MKNFIKAVVCCLIFVQFQSKAQQTFVERVTINNSTAKQPSLYLRNDPGVTNPSEQKFGYVFTNMAHGIMFQANTTGVDTNTAPGHMVIRTDGKVGIGTTSPGASLEINNPTTQQTALRVSPAGNSHAYVRFDRKTGYDGGILLTQNGALDYQLVNLDNRDFRIYSYSKSAPVFMIQNTTGNIGIGTTSPNDKLNVIGTVGIGITNGNEDLTVSNVSGKNSTFGLTYNSSADRFVLETEYVANNDGNLYLKKVDGSGGSPKTIQYWDNSGDIGIGTTDPKSKFHIVGEGNGSFRLTSANNDKGITLTNQPSLDRTIITFDPNDGETIATGSDYGFMARYSSAATNNATFGNVADQLQLYNYGDIGFWASTSSTSNIRMIIKSNGNVGIGTPTPESKLAVAGTIRAMEVKIMADVNAVPDFVFKADYDLATLEETEAYIEANGHLEAIPSAEEVGENGLDLGAMNLKLLQKVEELTLHLIEQNKQNKKQSNQIEEQSQQIKALRAELEQLKK